MAVHRKQDAFCELIQPMCGAKLFKDGSPIRCIDDLLNYRLLISSNRPADWVNWVAAAGRPDFALDRMEIIQCARFFQSDMLKRGTVTASLCVKGSITVACLSRAVCGSNSRGGGSMARAESSAEATNLPSEPRERLHVVNNPG